MAMAPTGQGATQAPQPLQAAGSIAGGEPATAMAKRIAPGAQASPQARQITPARPMHDPETAGRPAQDFSASRVKAP